MSKRENNCNSLVIGYSLVITKNKSYSLFFHLQILYNSILTLISLTTSIIATYYHCFYSNLDKIFHISLLAFFKVKILCIL